MQGRGGGGLPDPVFVVKVYVEDGREEIVRGCEFGDVDIRSLKDILAAGSKAIVSNSGSGSSGSTIVAPAVIFEELDVYRIEAEPEKTPTVPPPHARSGGAGRDR